MSVESGLEMDRPSSVLPNARLRQSGSRCSSLQVPDGVRGRLTTAPVQPMAERPLRRLALPPATRARNDTG